MDANFISYYDCMDATLANLAGVQPEEVNATEVVAEKTQTQTQNEQTQTQDEQELKPQEWDKTLAEYVLEKNDIQVIEKELEKRAEELDIELPDPVIKTEEQIEQEHEQAWESIEEAIENWDEKRLRVLVERLMENSIELEKKLTRENAVLMKTISILEAENNALVEENAKLKYWKKTWNKEIDEYAFLYNQYEKEKTKENASAIVDYHLKQIKIFYPDDFDLVDVKRRIRESSLRRLAAISGQTPSNTPEVKVEEVVNPYAFGVPIKQKLK